MIRRIGRNDPTLTKLHIHEVRFGNDEYETYTGNDYLRLGESVSENTQIKALRINLFCDISDMIEGLRQNKSINELRLQGGVSHPYGIDGGVALGVGNWPTLLGVYQEKNTLTKLCIQYTILQPISRDINTTLRLCTNLKQIDLVECNISCLWPMVRAIKGHHMLEKLNLYGNSIGQHGCQALGTLLEDPDCNIHKLNLMRNQIGNFGVNYLVKGLVNNSSLKCLDLVDNNPLDAADTVINENTIDYMFGRLLYRQTSNYVHPSNQSCPTLKYYANHTLERLFIDCDKSSYLTSLLEINMCSNKSYVAIKKILKQHQNIVVEPLFEWDESGEWSLKSLPYLIDWFQKAWDLILPYFEECSHSSDARLAAKNKVEARYQIYRRELSVLYDYAKAMPLLFVPPSHYKAVGRKRKRVENARRGVPGARKK